VKWLVKYSASLVSHALWFPEFKTYLDLYLKGKTIDELNQLSDDENLLQQKTNRRARQISRIIGRRLIKIDDEILELFPQLDVTNQKVVDLLGVMLNNKLFAEFVYEAYRPEMILGDLKLEDYEIQSFFNQKQLENKQVEGWTDQTIQRLKRSFKAFLRDSSLTKLTNGYDAVTPVLIDHQLHDLMLQHDLEYYLASLEGR
jgi:hypothetical protein